MPTASSSDVEIFFAAHGDAGAEPLLLVRGLGTQMTSWGQPLIDRYVAAGFFVIAFDNRDVGRSTHLEHAPVPRRVDFVATDGEAPPYSVLDMADDGLSVLDELGVESAHVLGISLGAAIAQRMAIHRPERLRSLISVMGTTNDPDVGRPSPEAMTHLLSAAPTDRDGAVDHALHGLELYGSPGAYDDPDDRAAERERQARMWDRDHDADGRRRQLWAAAVDGSRTNALGGVEAPTLAMHGSADRLISPDGGRRVAEAIPGARFVLIEGMGHDHPPRFWDHWVSEVAHHAGL